jgi:hypothetical protein
MTLLGRDLGEIDALVTDRYLDSLLAGRERPGPIAMPGRPTGRRRPGRSATEVTDPALAIDAAVRVVSRRLAGDLPRFHPSFRFEERLALRLAEAAAAMRLPLAAGGEGERLAIPIALPPSAADPLAPPLGDELGLRGDPRPLLVGGAVAASALSLAGAAWLAWRRRGASSVMARAVRAAHEARG